MTGLTQATTRSILAGRYIGDRRCGNRRADTDGNFRITARKLNALLPSHYSLSVGMVRELRSSLSPLSQRKHWMYHKYRSHFFTPLCLAVSLLPGILAADNRIDIQRPDAPALAAYGSYEVGTRPVQLVNSGQLDVLQLDASQGMPETLPTYDRPLTVQMWYPSYPGATGRKPSGLSYVTPLPRSI